MKFVKRLFARKSRPQSPVIQPIFNDAGVLLCSLRADGGMGAEQIDVPDAWKAVEGSGRPWYVGQLISLDLSSGVVVMRKGDVVVPVFNANGDDAQAKELLLQMRRLWLDANTQVHADVATPTPTRAAMPGMVQQQGGRSPWVRRMGFVLGFAGVFAVGLVSMYYYLHPGGAGLDLTGMSVEEVANIDSNPAMIREVQDQLVASVKIGQDNAKQLSGKIEQDHIAALKAMGLNPGVSMKNALSCLAQK